MQINGKTYRTIWLENNIVKIIDQTKLPHQFIIKDLKTVKDSINAIKTMEVRGAPLIGATAAYGLVLSILEKNDQSFLKKSSEDLIASRPTAINSSLDFFKKDKSLFSIIDKTKPYAAVAPINGAPLTSIVLIALIESFTVFKSFILN